MKVFEQRRGLDHRHPKTRKLAWLLDRWKRDREFAPGTCPNQSVEGWQLSLRPKRIDDFPRRPIDPNDDDLL